MCTQRCAHKTSFNHTHSATFYSCQSYQQQSKMTVGVGICKNHLQVVVMRHNKKQWSKSCNYLIQCVMLIFKNLLSQKHLVKIPLGQKTLVKSQSFFTAVLICTCHLYNRTLNHLKLSLLIISMASIYRDEC